MAPARISAHLMRRQVLVKFGAQEIAAPAGNQTATGSTVVQSKKGKVCSCKKN